MRAFSMGASSSLSRKPPTAVPTRNFADVKPGATKDKFQINKDGTIKVTFANNPFETHKVEAPKAEVTTSKDELIKFFTDMTVCRKMETAASKLYQQRQIRGFLHLYNGQEAIVSGYEAALTPKDHIITAYRDHGTLLGRGGSVFECFSELMGKETGCSGGKGGSMHMYRKEGNFHGGNGIVGAQVPVGAGIAFAQKYNNTGAVVMAMYGDGAANQGQIFEAYNMASLWKLPVLFGCENNKYGMGTSAERAAASTKYYTRGDFVPGIKIESMNVLSVKAGMLWAAEYARSGKGPLVVEFETYRYMGHSMSDPGISYRSKEEVAAIRAERDPIEKVRAYLLENELATESELEAIDKRIKQEVDEAAKKATEANVPKPSQLYNDVYTDSSKPYWVRGVDLASSTLVDK
jgi:pyruvate dehydrogenase E1 component alpha subunit